MISAKALSPHVLCCDELSHPLVDALGTLFRNADERIEEPLIASFNFGCWLTSKHMHVKLHINAGLFREWRAAMKKPEPCEDCLDLYEGVWKKNEGCDGEPFSGWRRVDLE